VYQIETAMGAAIEVFDGAAAIGVGRERFLPVKTTNDLLLVRSDCYELSDAGGLRLAGDAAPVVDLDEDHYQTVAGFDARFPRGAPSLRAARGLTVRGAWTFGADVVVSGEVKLDDPGEPRHIADGTKLGEG
jgi:UTP--glucose-1-phosphate uridylyltransferase